MCMGYLEAKDAPQLHRAYTLLQLLYGGHICCGGNRGTCIWFPRKWFDGCHPNSWFTNEHETKYTFHYSDVEVLRKDQISLVGYIFHRPTWTGQYLNFSPVQTNSNTIILHQDEANLLHRDTLRWSATRFFRSEGEQLSKEIYHQVWSKTGSECHKVRYSKENVVISLPFTGDQNGGRKQWWVRHSVERTYCATRPVAQLDTKRMLDESTWDRRDPLLTSTSIPICFH